MLDRFRRLMPDPQTVRNYRMLRWLAPHLNHPRLWHINRRGIAMGVAIGIFFGLLIPVAQIVFAVIAALVLRANIPAAIASTLITNPFTFAPVYYGAYRLGAWILHEPAVHLDEIEAHLPDLAAESATGLSLWIERIGSVGAPLALGLVTLAVVLSLVIYFAVHWAWRVRIARAWQRRQRHRRRRTR